MADRLGKAKAIFDSNRVMEITPEYREFEVLGDTDAYYTVKLSRDGKLTCCCEDRAPFCKHKLAVLELVNQRQ